MKRLEKKKKTLNAKLYVRFLPTADFDYDSIKVESNKKVMYVRSLQDLAAGDKVKIRNYWCFCTDGIFWNACQQEIYDAVTGGIYDELFDGVSVMIIAFGQTGTGKTTTTSGLRFRYQNRGLILRILSQIFEEAESRMNLYRINLGLSYLEFMGKHMTDLILNQQTENIKDVIEHPIISETWAWKQIFQAETRKTFVETAPYKGSNCGHSVLTFYIHSQSLLDSDPIILHSKIHIVDMGGIDSFEKTVSTWKQREDVGQANLAKSLMEQLVLCLTGTSFKNKNHVSPYKSSKFLMYLYDCLTPKCVLKFLAHVNGKRENLPMTISTLKFGDRLRTLRPTKLEKNFETNCALHVNALEKELVRLRDEAELSNMFSDSPDVTRISQERFQQITRAAEAFLYGQLKDLTLLSLGQAELTLEVFRNLYQKLCAEKDQLVKDAVAAATEALQAQFTLEKTSTSALSVVPPTQKLSRRKSIQKDSEISFASAVKSTASSQTAFGKPSVEFGVSDRRGISIGVAKNSYGFEGSVTKAVKKLRSRRSESIVVKETKSSSVKDIVNPPSKHLAIGETEPLPKHMPPTEDAWQQFLTENGDTARELHNNIETWEAAALEAKKKYLTALADLSKIRTEIEEWKFEAGSRQHARHIFGKEEFGEDYSRTNYFLADSEKNLKAIIEEKEKEQNILVENCHVAFINLRTAVEELNDAKKPLEGAFQEFTRKNYNIPYPVDECPAEVKWEESGLETMAENDLRNQTLSDLYFRLHQKLINYRPTGTKFPTKPWVTLF